MSDLLTTLDSRLRGNDGLFELLDLDLRRIDEESDYLASLYPRRQV